MLPINGTDRDLFLRPSDVSEYRSVTVLGGQMPLAFDSVLGVRRVGWRYNGLDCVNLA